MALPLRNGWRSPCSSEQTRGFFLSRSRQRRGSSQFYKRFFSSWFIVKTTSFIPTLARRADFTERRPEGWFGLAGFSLPLKSLIAQLPTGWLAGVTSEPRG